VSQYYELLGELETQKRDLLDLKLACFTSSCGASRQTRKRRLAKYDTSLVLMNK
jgi:hypothetical protein